ncbi:MAG TPA: GMC family oxidoreductase N-terminal domain-containing protein [Vicinamibacterales bacterium]|nr:GMC family oxidoreductase N-terminal domain-containing protein [Vicinamibacterales bacterium]
MTFGTAAAAAAHARTSIPEFDYIVIGAGSSGCVLVHRLTADPAVRVLLVEAGGADHDDPAILTPGRWVGLLGSRWDWAYRTEPEPGLNNRRIDWPRGKGLGGSSVINAMAFVRGHALDFDGWRDLGNPGWGYADVLPYFKRSEHNSRGASEYRGGDGLLAVSDTTDPHAGHEAFLEAARSLGYDARPDWDFNGERQENAAGFYQKNILDGRRHSVAAAFLVPALGRPNLTVHTGSLVTRIVLARGRARGIEYVRGGRVERVHAAREVILCAGAIDSPKLLLLSGIGPADHLRTHGIPVVADLPGVGANLQDHLRIGVRWRGRQELSPSSVSAGLFVRSNPSRTSSPPDLEYYVGRGLDQPDPFVTITVALARPASRGIVRLASARPDDPPRIHARYLSDPADLDAVLKGVRLARTMGQSRAFERLVAEELEPGPEARTDEELAAFVRASAGTIFHPAGTCAMGRDRMSVVDATLRVRGVEGLRVADASIMPTVVNAPTHAACVMIGERAADLIARQRG